MTYYKLFNYKRKQELKSWEPIPNTEPELINYFNNRVEIDGLSIRDRPVELFEKLSNTLKETDLYYKYIKHVSLLHMNYVIKYIESKGIFLGDIEWNIKLILNEMINDEVDESYYENTMEIYADIIPYDIDNIDVYDYLDQAIKRGNWRMVYYLIFWEDEEMADRLSEVNMDYQCDW